MDSVGCAKFDVHAHIRGPKTDCVEALDALGIRTVLNMSYSGFRGPEDLLHYESALREETDLFPDRFCYCTSFSITHFDEPGYAKCVVAKLTHDVAEYGTKAVKIWKDLGMMLKDRSGEYVFCDDPHFTPIFDFIAERGLVLIAHLADPKAAWLPLDPASPHFGYYAAHPEFHWYGKRDRPLYDEILEHRANLLRRYPSLRVVACHLASAEHDVREIAAFLGAFPNTFVDTAGRYQDLAFQPDDVVREFFLAHQDRILYGTDWEADERTFSADPAERARQIEALVHHVRPAYVYYDTRLALPEEVLRKLDCENAAQLFLNAR